MDSISIRKILKRYLEGKASRQERNSVNRWYQSFQDHPIGQQQDDDARQEVWLRIEAAIYKPERFIFKVTWLRAAAVLFIITAGAAAWLAFRNNGLPKKATFAVFRTTTGERRSVVLADGSRLMLNSSTQIRVPEDLTRNRYVELTDGEVFFDVTHDPHRPFTVRSGSLTTKVLGTSFNIRAYRQATDVRVSVTSGRVSVSEENALLGVLIKDQSLIFNKADSTFMTTVVQPGALAWREGIIALEDATFTEMALRLQTHYGVYVKTTDPQVRKAHYTAMLRAEMKPGQAIEVLAAVHGFNVQLKQDTVILYQ